MKQTATVIVGDNRQTLKQLPDQSVQTVITSPPYWGLRDYGNDSQIGHEPTPAEFIEELCQVFDEVWRVLKDDGTLWVNLGDTYTREGGKTAGVSRHWDGRKSDPGGLHNIRKLASEINMKQKELVGIPWRFAFAMQDRGWYLRQDIIWAKPNPMPESVTDRCTKSHEYIFLLTKSPKYYFDHEAIKESAEQDGQRNKRDVWSVAVKPYADAHFATYPAELITPCVLAGTSEKGNCANCGSPYSRILERPKPPEVEASDLDRFGDGSAGVHRKVGQKYQDWLNANPAVTIGWQKNCDCLTDEISIPLILDPFSGSGTTGEVALNHGRNYIGLELNPDYAKLSEKRLTNAAGMFGEVFIQEGNN